jgi:hypothetical protein
MWDPEKEEIINNFFILYAIINEVLKDKEKRIDLQI